MEEALVRLQALFEENAFLKAELGRLEGANGELKTALQNYRDAAAIIGGVTGKLHAERIMEVERLRATIERLRRDKHTLEQVLSCSSGGELGVHGGG